MRAQGIVKGSNIGKNIHLSSTAGVIPAQVNQFTFETAEKAFRHSVVVGVAFAGHALADTQGGQPVTEGRSSILNTPVAVEDQPGLRSFTSYRHVQCGESQLGVNAVGKGVTHNLLGA